MPLVERYLKADIAETRLKKMAFIGGPRQVGENLAGIIAARWENHGKASGLPELGRPQSPSTAAAGRIAG